MKIEILGKERQIKFNIYGIEQMQNKNDAGSSITSVYAMVWGGLEGARYANEEERDYKFGDVIDAVDAMAVDARTTLIQEVTKVFTESQAFKTLVPETTPVPEKKKVTRKRSTNT